MKKSINKPKTNHGKKSFPFAAFGGSAKAGAKGKAPKAFGKGKPFAKGGKC